MKFYFAPLEGITGHLYRNAHNKFYSGIDAYYAPFVSLGQGKKMTPKARKDIAVENNQNINVIPQLLTNRANLFIKAVDELIDMGYSQVNLNLGCPSKTVVTKKKGAGFLQDTEELDTFLYEIFAHQKMAISIKTRLGLTDECEFEALLSIFNKYKLEELIIHPRLMSDMYHGHPRMKMFDDAILESKNKLCYNGDIFTSKDYAVFHENYPQIDHVMLGRGLLRNPALVMEILGTPQEEHLLCDFHEEIYQAYIEEMSGPRNVLFKMKELWIYLSESFDEGDIYLKQIRKAQTLSEYERITKQILK